MTHTIRTTTRAAVIGALLGSAALIGATPAQAQNAVPQAAATDTSEIVVTAEKRSSTVQKTPISITAISGSDITARGANDFSKLAQEIPGIAERTGGPGQTEFEMRGLSSSGGAAATVGFFLDETPLTAASFTQNGKVVIDPNLYDLQRVEVLRGPQGTLYGSGSMGGAIKLVTAQPNLDKIEYSANGSVSGTDGGNGANNSENVMLNVPLVPGQLALRLVGSVGYTTGWIDRDVIGIDNATTNPTDWNQPLGSTSRGLPLGETPTAVHHDVNDTHTRSVRATLTYQPDSSLTITPMFMYQKGDQGGYSAYDSVPGTMVHYQPFDLPESISDEFVLGSLVVKYHAAAFDVTSATAYWHRTENQFQDASENLALAGFGGSVYVDQGGAGASLNNEQDTSRQFSEELRVSSNGNGPLTWLAGVFYSDFRSEFFLDEPTAGLPTFAANVGAPTVDGTNLITIDEPTTIKQFAVFGEAAYKITPELKFTAGLRYFDFHTTASSFQNGFIFDGTTLYNVTVPLANSNTGINPKFNLSYQADPNLLLYATISKGFRPSGVNQPTSTSFGCPVTPLTFAQDSVWNYEAGEKAKLADGRVTFNSDGYYEHWSNVQSIVDLVCGFSYTGNSANANIYGGEAELAIKLVEGATSREGLTLAGSAGYAHAQYAGDSPSTFIVNGDPMLNIPHWTATTSATYAQSLGNGMMLTARANYSYVGSREELTLYASTNGSQPGYQALPSYGLTDLRLSLSKNNWTLGAFANNVGNVHAQLAYLNILSFNTFAYNRTVTNQPRTMGMDFTIRY
jgi:outer membrane receptor protein involved in Fe transport